MSAAELLEQLNAANDRANGYIGQFSLAESMLLRPTNTALPTLAPLTTGLQSSSFGWRIDPFNGHQAFHEGLDFAVPLGTPIRAAGAGTVVYAGFHPQYGNMAEIDHGNNLTSRYAHSSKLLVKVGDHVEAGQIIADVAVRGVPPGRICILKSGIKVWRKIRCASWRTTVSILQQPGPERLSRINSAAQCWKPCILSASVVSACIAAQLPCILRKVLTRRRGKPAAVVLEPSTSHTGPMPGRPVTVYRSGILRKKIEVAARRTSR